MGRQNDGASHAGRASEHDAGHATKKPVSLAKVLLFALLAAVLVGIVGMLLNKGRVVPEDVGSPGADAVARNAAAELARVRRERA